MIITKFHRIPENFEMGDKMVKSYALYILNRSKLLLRICGLLFCLGIVFCMNAEAASSRTVQKAYGEFLKKHKAISISDHDFYNAGYTPSNKSFIKSFALYDIDKDKIPELITTSCLNFRWSIVRIYRYKNGKVTFYKFRDRKKAEWNNCATANGAYVWYICNRRHIHNTWSGYEGLKATIYEVNTKKKRLDYFLAHTLRTTYPEVDFYGGADNGYDFYAEISRRTYDGLIKKCKPKKLKYYANTSLNRKKLSKGNCKISK